MVIVYAFVTDAVAMAVIITGVAFIDVSFVAIVDVSYAIIVFFFSFLLSLSVCLRLRIKEPRQRENKREIEGHSPRFMYAVCIRFALCLIHAILYPQNVFAAMYNTGLGSKLAYAYKLVM